MNFVMNHAPGAQSISRPVHQQSSMLPLCSGQYDQNYLNIEDNTVGFCYYIFETREVYKYIQLCGTQLDHKPLQTK